MTAAARTLGHWISFGLTLALMVGVLGFVLYTRKNRKGMKTAWQRNGPAILVAVAVPLIMADLLRHVLQDEGAWLACIPKAGGGCEWYSSAEYKAGEAETTTDENASHLSTIGVLFTIVATYSGFILLASGTLWNANIMSKVKVIKAKWRQLRAQAAARSSSSGKAASHEAAYVSVNA